MSDIKALETERLLLREPRMSDAEDMYEYAKSPNVGPNAGWKPHENIEETREILQKLFIDKNTDDEIGAEARFIELKETGKVIGSIAITRKNQLRDNIEGQVELGYALSEKHWGSGIMSEAVQRILEYCFLEKKLQAVTIRHLDINERSKKVIERANFKFEGIMRYAMQRDDGVHDMHIYSMLRREYLVRNAAKKGLRLELIENLSEKSYLEYYEETREDEVNETNRFITPMAADLQGRDYKTFVADMKTSASHPKEGFVPDTTYFLVNADDRILGAINIRHELNDYLRHSGGHIGYGVRPGERRKRYAETMLALAIDKIESELKLDTDKILITCNDENIGSAKTIEACRGVLENKVQGMGDGKLTRRYWITL